MVYYVWHSHRGSSNHHRYMPGCLPESQIEEPLPVGFHFPHLDPRSLRCIQTPWTLPGWSLRSGVLEQLPLGASVQRDV